METVIACSTNGLALSAMYILVAVGFALMLSIMGIFNFAHGAIYMVGSFITYGFSVSFGINQWIALLLSVIVVGLFGLFLEKFCFRPFSGNNYAVIVMAIATIFALQQTVNLLLGGFTRALPPFIPGVFGVGFFSISWQRILTIFVGAIILLATTLFITKSQTGQQMLATSQDKEGAALQGININRISATATFISCSLAALAGSLMAALFSMSPYMGDNILLKAIEVVILSGIGSIGGILIAGLIVGLMDAVLPILTTAHIAAFASIAVIVIILLFRPKGLFGYELF